MTGSAAPDVSIVIVTLNAARHIEACLRSLLAPRDPGLEVEIIVSDNGSTDATISIVESFPTVVLLRGDNVGYGAGNNRGIRVSRGRYVLILNDDTVVLPGALAALVTFMDTHAGVGIVGPKLLNADGSLQPSITTYPRAWRDIARVLLPTGAGGGTAAGKQAMRTAGRLIPGFNVGRYGSHETDAEVEGVKGACLMVRRRVIETVGMFDEAIFLHTEESDWACRIRKAGWGAMYHPAAAVVHFGGSTFGRAADETLGRRFIQKHKSNLYFLEKHRGSAYAFAYRVAMSGALAWRILLTTIAALSASDAAARRYSRQREVFHATLRLLWDSEYAKQNIFLEMRFKNF